MTNFISLIKVQLFSLLSASKKTKSRKKAGAGGIAFVLLLMGGALALFGYVYSDLFAKGLMANGNAENLIPAMVAIASLISFMFSFYAVGSTLFGFKDYDMLMSMPLKPTEIVLSKFAVLYVSELFFSIFIVVPSLFVYNNVVANISFVQVVSSIILIIFSPLLPLAISCVVGVIVYFVSSRFRRKNLIQLILLLIVLVGIFAFSFVSGIYSEDPSRLANSLGAIGKIYFIFPWAVKAFVEPIWLLVFILTNFLPLAIVIAFICVFYKKLNTIFTSKKTLRNFKLGEYQSKSVNKTLFNKELKRLFSTPVYAVNCLLGAVMALIASIAYSVVYIALKVSSSSELTAVFEVFNVMVPALFCFMFLLSPTTCCSISLEGQSFWIIKTAPVSHMQILLSKLAVHAIFNTTVAFVSSLLIGVCANFGVLGTVLLVLCSVGISSFGGVFGLLMNLRFPNLSWTNENAVVKQSLPIFLSVLVSMAFAGGLIAIAIYVRLSVNVLLAIYAGFFILLTVVLFIILYKFSGKLFNRLN